MEFLDEETVTIDQSGDLPGQTGVDGQGGGGLVLAPGFSTESLSQGSAFPNNRLMTISSELSRPLREAAHAPPAGKSR